MKKLKKGDSCYFHFELGTVHDITHDGRITTFKSEWGGSTGSFDLTDECFPVEDSVVEIAKLIKSCKDKVFELNQNGLNYPEIHGRYCAWFYEMCNVRDNAVAVEVLGDKVVAFTNDIVHAIKTMRKITVDGTGLMR